MSVEVQQYHAHVLTVGRDIDRFFETKPGIFVFNNKLATQLSRPQIYADQDEAIAQQADKGSGWGGDEEKGDGRTAVESVEL